MCLDEVKFLLFLFFSADKTEVIDFGPSDSLGRNKIDLGSEFFCFSLCAEFVCGV